jgi:2-polyprenyl-3-methyl-5-hydroxy-6-metoxy-1,4-benzoquinol methylase
MFKRGMRILHPRIPGLPPGCLYGTREARSQFVARHFSAIIKGKVLDVGCSTGGLRAALPQTIECIGLDLYGTPDIRFDLDSGFLPFTDRAFDVVVCTDVLEHLEQVHAVFDELIRVCREHVIVSLPNCWHGNWRWVLPGTTLRSGKYYGLSGSRPRDRHRWFFNTHEAVEFLRERSEANGARVVWQDVVRPHAAYKQAMMRAFWGPRYWDWAAAAVWTIVERQA